MHKLQKIIVFMFFLQLPAFHAVCAVSFQPDSSIFALLDSFFNENTDIVYVEKLTKKPTVYLGGAFATISAPLKSVTKVLLDFNGYKNTFRYLHAFDELDSIEENGGSRTFFGEARAAFIRIWSIAGIDSIHTDSSTWVEVWVSQNEDSTLNAHRRSMMPRWFSIEIAQTVIRGRLKKLDDNSCRVALFGWSHPKIAVPAWIVKFASRIVIPHFIDDIREKLKQSENDSK